jgi:hypothetical protein
MSFWHRLLYLFDLRPDPEPQTYNLNSDLHLIIADLAQREQRSTEEIAKQLLGQALRERQAAMELWQPGSLLLRASSTLPRWSAWDIPILR